MAYLKRQAPVPALPTDPAYYTWSIQSQILSITLVLTILALLTVLGRVYIRIFTLRVFGADDWLISAAMLLSILSCVCFSRTIQLGMGKHLYAIPLENVRPLLHWIFAYGVLVATSINLVKLSITCFLLRLTKKTKYRHFLWFMIGFLVILTIFTLCTLLVSCIPLAAMWDFSLRAPPLGTGNAKCLSTSTFRSIGLATNIANIITDVVLALFPVPLVWTLQTNLRTRISLMLILSLGFFACVAAVIKTPKLYHFFDDIDSTGKQVWFYVWQIIEMNIGIIAATLPALKPAFHWLLETARSLTSFASAGRSENRTYKRKGSSSLGYFVQKSNPDVNEIALSRVSRRKVGFESDEVQEITEVGGFDDRSADERTSSEAGLTVDMEKEKRLGGIVKTTRVTLERDGV